MRRAAVGRTGAGSSRGFAGRRANVVLTDAGTAHRAGAAGRSEGQTACIAVPGATVRVGCSIRTRTAIRIAAVRLVVGLVTAVAASDRDGKNDDVEAVHEGSSSDSDERRPGGLQTR
jgi:hypothetical protein